MHMKRSLTYSFVTTLLTLVLSFTISCGGGGGGGGGTVGPAAASETTSDNEPKVSAPVKSSAAEVISFKFEQAKNAPALSALSSDLEGNLSNNQEITVNYNYGTLNEQPALKPSIKVSSG
ncbi:MAG: hypothetical protein J6V73_07855, partial [Spirochaetaceae bacterium]|nr:hypothetical protein [Spirochaetaceae bacterium]